MRRLVCQSVLRLRASSWDPPRIVDSSSHGDFVARFAALHRASPVACPSRRSRIPGRGLRQSSRASPLWPQEGHLHSEQLGTLCHDLRIRALPSAHAANAQVSGAPPFLEGSFVSILRRALIRCASKCQSSASPHQVEPLSTSVSTNRSPNRAACVQRSIRLLLLRTFPPCRVRCRSTRASSTGRPRKGKPGLRSLWTSRSHFTSSNVGTTGRWVRMAVELSSTATYHEEIDGHPFAHRVQACWRGIACRIDSRT